MDERELMPIGAFAELAGLTASALRFYDDAGVLGPERVDPLTGYRFYHRSQLARATHLRLLREIRMPLRTIGRLFAGSTAEAARLIDEQAAAVAAEAAGIQRAAATLKASLGQASRITLCALPGPVFAAAVDQVLATTIDDPAHPVLAGVRLEARHDAVSLTATDRFRLTTRTLVPGGPSTASWAGTLAGDDLRAAASRLRRSPIVTMEAGERTLSLRTSDHATADCRLLTGEFPDHRLMVAALPPVTHRVTTETRQIHAALAQAPERIGLRLVDGTPSLLLPGAVLPLDATATGPDLTVWFELTTLYPAVSCALGADLMLDLRGADQPTTIRSADDGDLTAVVMPCRPSPT
ncbi:DNA polymerase III subunit beta family protein [Tomitella gaofuii]|uniref:DNA polymerase III subunit beta family protein n=1 Tax=Tomitella gaofuii TaxID=2760083 RepID=UPI0015F97942|nr:MerR family transcriptional regulator [Tomitella gaofuii]